LEEYAASIFNEEDPEKWWRKLENSIETSIRFHQTKWYHIQEDSIVIRVPVLNLKPTSRGSFYLSTSVKKMHETTILIKDKKR
jgi:hypothetical protein